MFFSLWQQGTPKYNFRGATTTATCFLCGKDSSFCRHYRYKVTGFMYSCPDISYFFTIFARTK